MMKPSQRNHRKAASKPRPSKLPERVLGVACLALLVWALWQGFITSKINSQQGEWIAVEEGPVAQPILTDGTLLPAVLINITPPFDGKILKKFVQVGDSVTAGMPLVELDSNDAQAERRDAEVARTRAAEALHDLQTWSSNPEVTNAQRQLSRAKTTYEQAQKRYAETNNLYKQGIVPRTELETIDNERANASSEFKTAQETLASVLKKGSASQIRIAQLEYQNRHDKLTQIEKRLGQTLIRAPQAGIVLAPIADANSGSSTKEIEIGSFVSAKDVMMSIGNTTTLMVRAQLDEYDISRVKTGLPVEITLGADKTTVLQGELQRISSQAKKSDSGANSAITFEIQVFIRTIPAAVRHRIRLGMTAHLSIFPEKNQRALSIPLNAVNIQDETHAKVLRRNSQFPNGTEVVIQTGATQADRIVVLKGLQAGDEVFVPPTTPQPTPSDHESNAGTEGSHDK